jgi:hypothetical protein
MREALSQEPKKHRPIAQAGVCRSTRMEPGWAWGGTKAIGVSMTTLSQSAALGPNGPVFPGLVAEVSTPESEKFAFSQKNPEVRRLLWMKLSPVQMTRTMLGSISSRVSALWL